MTFEFYQVWVQQNHGNYLDGGIIEDDKWRARWNFYCFSTESYYAPSGKVGRKFVSTLSVDLDGI